MNSSALESFESTFVGARLANSGIAVREAWAQFCYPVARPRKVVSSPLPLNNEEMAWLRRFRRTEIFNDLSKLAVPEFAAIDLRTTLSSQPWIYANGVDITVSDRVSDRCELAAGSSFIPIPVVDSDGSILFRNMQSNTIDLHGVTVHRPSTREIKINLSLKAQLNFIRVIPFESALLMTNGHHRANAMLRAGFTRILAILSEDRDIEGMLHKQNLFDLATIRECQPTLMDFLDEGVTHLVEVPNLETNIRVKLGMKRERKLIIEEP